MEITTIGLGVRHKAEAGFTLSGTDREQGTGQVLADAPRLRFTIPATVFLLSPTSRPTRR